MQLLNSLKWPLTLIVMTALIIGGGVLIGGPLLGVPEATQTAVTDWATGIGAVLAAPLMFLFAYLSRDDDDDGTPDFLQSRSPRAERESRRTSLPPPGSLTAMFLAVALGTVFLSGCGASFLDYHAPVAQAAQELQVQSEPVIRELRIQALELAIREVAEDGGTRADAEAVRARVERDWLCPVAGHRVYASAVSTYIEALWLARETGEEPPGGDGDGNLDAADFIPLARHVVDAYLALASCANTFEPGQLPTPGFLELISNAEVPRG